MFPIYPSRATVSFSPRPHPIFLMFTTIFQMQGHFLNYIDLQLAFLASVRNNEYSVNDLIMQCMQNLAIV